MWVVKMVAFLSAKGLSAVLKTGFRLTLLAKEDDTLNENDATEKAQVKARDQNAQAMWILTWAMRIPEMINMINLEKKKESWMAVWSI